MLARRGTRMKPKMPPTPATATSVLVMAEGDGIKLVKEGVGVEVMLFTRRAPRLL